MNRKKRKIGNEYRHLQIKIFIRTTLMMFAAIIFIFGLYSFFLQGHFANIMVAFLDFFIYRDYQTALSVYRNVFRNNIELIFGISIIIVFLIIIRLYLNNFTKYFSEINGGIDALIEENDDEVELSPELAATEKKINYIKHTLRQRKLSTENAEKKKNDLVVYLAHDLKTPLTSVIGYLTLLRDESQISEELREKYLSISLEKAQRLEDLINEFFEIARFNLSDISLEYSRINLTRMLEQLVFEFRPMFLEKQLDCVLNITPDIMINCDVDKMQRVFDNLLRNAVNYSFDNEVIEITVLQDDDYIRVKFANHGNDIPEEKLEHIFQQFYRLDVARNAGNGGAGLGLAIAKEIVELHNGSIYAKSKDGIIEFEVVIPLS